MRYSLGAPIEYCPSMKGYYYSDETFTLPTRFLTAGDQQVLSYLARQYANLGQGQIKRIASLLQRLSELTEGGERQPGVPALEVTAREIEVFNILKESLKQHLKVELTFRPTSDSSPEHALFSPYKLFVRNGANQVVGYCELLQDMRFIELGKIGSIRLTDFPYKMEAHFDENQYTSQGFARFPMVEFRSAVDTTRLPRPYREIGNNRYLIKFHDSQQLLLTLLGSCSDFRIHSLQWLQNKLKSHLLQLLNRRD